MSWNLIPKQSSSSSSLTIQQIATEIMTPYLIPSGKTFTVPDKNQVLFSVPIEVNGVLAIDGVMVEVD